MASMLALIALGSPPLDFIFQVVDGRLVLALDVGGDFIAGLGKHLLGLVHELFGVVLHLHLLFLFLVALGIGLGVLDHALDFASLRPLDDSMRICCCLPVPRSLALTFMMPLASMSKVTSTCGTPRGAGGNADEIELAEQVGYAAAISRSP